MQRNGRRGWLAGCAAGIFVFGLLAAPPASQGRTLKGRTSGELSRTQEWGEAPDDGGAASRATPSARSVSGSKTSRRLGESETLNRLFPVGSPTADPDPQGREIRRLIHLLGGERHESQAAVERLTVIGLPAVPALRDALRDRYKFTRVRALNALGYIRDRDSAPCVEALLNDPAYEVRAEAVKTLGLMKHKPSLAVLTEKSEDPEPRVRRELATALARLRNDEARRALIRLLADRSAEVRRQAAQEMSAFSDSTAVEALLSATHDSDPKTCGFAARALGEIGDAAARARLRELSQSQDRFIRREALQALQNIN